MEAGVSVIGCCSPAGRLVSPRLLALVLVAAVPAVAAQGEEIPAWYLPAPPELAGLPGTVIRQERLTAGAPAGALAWKILYRSTGLHGEPIAVSGLLVVPDDVAPAGGRPIVAWAHPSSGVAQSCAPSLLPDGLRTVMGLARFVDHGYVVVATDYPGLGTPGPHPYLVGVSEGRAVLDSVRAARNIREAHAGNRFAVWGHSQGGHAALYAGMLAHEYAPELQLVGVAVAAPATDLRALTVGSNTDPTLQAMLMHAWSRIYDLPLDRLVRPGEQPRVEELAQACLDIARDGPQPPPEAPAPRVSYRIRGAIGDTKAWASIAARNSTGVLPREVPVFLALGGADTLIPQELNICYMQRLCKAGVPVHLVVVPGANHHFVGRDAAGAAVDWISARFARQPAPDDCR